MLIFSLEETFCCLEETFCCFYTTQGEPVITINLNTDENGCCIIKNITIKIIIFFLFCVQSEDPQLEFDFNCEYRVLWKTEHACPDVAVTSSTCHLHNPQRNLDIDLSPLTNSPGTTQGGSKKEDVDIKQLLSSVVI